MKEITIKTQAEWNALPSIFPTPTRIFIEGDISIKLDIDRAHVVARGSAHVEARGSAHVEAWESAHVVARGSAHVEAWGQSVIRILSNSIKLVAHGFSIVSMAKNISLAFKFDQTVTIHRYEQQPFIEREGIEATSGYVVLFKRVSADFKTQEGTEHETSWQVGAKVTHPEWSPTFSECGKGKFHACSRPYFCNEFRSTPNDKYIAIKIKVDDLYEWPNAQYPHKIAFMSGMVLYECDCCGNKIGG